MNLHTSCARALLITATHQEAMRRADSALKDWLAENGPRSVEEWDQVLRAGEVDLSWSLPVIHLVRWFADVPDWDEDLVTLGCLLPRDDTRQLPGPESWSLLQRWGTDASDTDDPHELLAAIVAAESAAAIEASTGWLEPQPDPEKERVS